MESMVVDSSVVMKLFVEETYSENAYLLFSRMAEKEPPIFYVPDLIYIECSNVFIKYIKRYNYPLTFAKDNLKYLSLLPLSPIPVHEFFDDTFELASKLNITTYDASYLVLAERLNCPFITADKKLLDKVKDRFKEALWIKDVK
ncbi:MAG TPA: PIN domain-containing protein [Candidatus Omnitrophica bacterium]|nr:PIN domain-containing protein [Candidatus Omnitrophota bacterium]